MLMLVLAAAQVTLQNSALINMDTDPTGGFKKLNFLLSNTEGPAETFGNLLLLYCKPQHGFYDLAADVMAENPPQTASLLTRVRPASLCSSSSSTAKVPCVGRCTH